MTKQPNPQPPGDEKKIIIDEDWKARVESERKAAAAGSQEPPSPQAPAEWPEPSLVLLATTLATQAMVGLGLVVHPMTGKATIDLPQARHFIDTLAMLLEKTEGHRSEEESAMLDHTLHELRMTFLSVSERVKESTRTTPPE